MEGTTNYNAATQATKQGCTLITSCDLPNDPHLQMVLCDTGGQSVQQFVSWFFNKETGGFSSGDYSNSLTLAAVTYEARCRRYGAKPSADDVIQYAAKLLHAMLKAT